MALLQPARHRVEFVGQRADFVAAPDGDALRQVAFAELLGANLQPPDRRGDATREPDADHCATSSPVAEQ